jgi:hypothetical protein
MTEREKVQKAFNQCSDALSQLDQKLILKVFHLLSVQFDIVATPQNNQLQNNRQLNEQAFTSLSTENDYEPLNEVQETKKNSSVSKKRNPVAKTPTFLTDFDFRPSNKESLKDFYQKYNAKSNLEKNLIFTYYLQNIAAVDNITVSHIFSCYRHMGFKVPLFPQTLIDTKIRKGWIDTSNSNNLKVTREGMNFLEHDMPKKDDE